MVFDPLKRESREQKKPGVEVQADNMAMREKEKHLKDYLDGMKNLDPKAKRDFFAKSLEWDRSGDFTELRRAGRTKSENERDSMKKYSLLSALYLERDQNKPGEMNYKINFGNELARNKVGLGDMLPPLVKSVKVWDEKGEVVTEHAFRAINPENGRIGYYDRKIWEESKTHKYIAVFDNYRVQVLSTGDAKDPEVSRHTFSEHREIYENNRSALVGAMKTGPGNRGASLKGGPMGGVAPSASSVAGYSSGSAGNKRPETAGEETVSTLPGYAETMNLSAVRKRITEVAGSFVNVPREEFRSADINGGVLGCAKVVSTILKQAGFMDQVILGVDNTISDLLKRGWVYSNEKPEAGDIIVWAGMNRQIKGAVDDAPSVVTGHKHIGIALGPNSAISNSSSMRMPTQHAIYTGRAVEAVLKPPQSVRTSQVSPQKSSKQNGPNIPAQNHRSKDMAIIAEDHSENLKSLQINSDKKSLVDKFYKNFEKNRQHYDRVAAATDIPAILIATIHYMEAGMLFDRYLHNGQVLGKETTFVPKGILFGTNQWEEAAIHALGGNIVDLKGNKSLQRFQDLRRKLGITKETTDVGKLLAIAETFNGLGYRNKGTTPSPYIYAGTNMYEKGLYVADGKFDPDVRHKGIGIAALLEGGKENGRLQSTPTKPGTAVA